MNTCVRLVTLVGSFTVVARAEAPEPAAPATPSCVELASDAAWGLVGNPNVAALTAVVTPAAAPNQAYCQVDFTDVSLSGPRYGYLDGQTSKIRVRVGLPLNARPLARRAHATRCESAATRRAPWLGGRSGRGPGVDAESGRRPHAAAGGA